MMLKNKTLVVCGAGPGLGSEVARGALRDGANLVLAARTEKKLTALADELQAPERVAVAVTDIRDEQDCARLAAVGLLAHRGEGGHARGCGGRPPPPPKTLSGNAL